MALFGVFVDAGYPARGTGNWKQRLTAVTIDHGGVCFIGTKDILFSLSEKESKGLFWVPICFKCLEKYCSLVNSLLKKHFS